MSIFGSSSANSQVSTKIAGYRVQESMYGTCIPILYGQTRVAGNTVWLNDWVATPVQSGGKGKGGGGGSKGKGGGGTDQQYTYKTAIIIAYCQGQIVGVRNVWMNRTKLALATSGENYTVPGGGGTFHPANQANLILDHGVAGGYGYSVGANDYGSPGSVTLTGTQQIPLVPVAGAPGAGQYKLNTDGSYDFSAADAGLQIRVTYSWTIPNADGSLNNPLGTLAFSLFTGALGQSPWSYLTSHHPEQAIGYSELAYIASEAMDLGSSGAISNLSLEIAGLLQFGGGVLDAEPSMVAYDLLTNPHYGVGFPSASVGPLTNYANYCKANGLFVSLLLDTQRPAAEWIGDLLLIGNTEAVFSEGLLKFRPRGDTTAIGNGATFTPDTQPIYDLDDDDFQDKGTDPVIINRPTVRDAYNRKIVEWWNRNNGYNAETCPEEDDQSIALYGLRPDSVLSLHGITSHDVAAKVASTELAKSVYVRAQVTFRLGWQYCLLEPMDLVTVTDPYLGWIKQPVRILSIDEDAEGTLTVNAEEFPWGTAGPTLHPKQVTASFGPGFFSDPGMTNTPTFFEPPDQMTKKQGFALWMGLSGPANWGGCAVFMSTDNATFENIGIQNGPSAMGVLTASLGANADPDTTHTLSVDMTMSGAKLASFTQAQADGFLSLVLVDEEIIAYETATLTAPDKYDITYLRRGVFGTPIGAHTAGSTFCVLDASMFDFKFETTDIGQTRYFKFASFNQSGQQQQDLSALTSIPYTLTDPNPRYITATTNPTNFTQLPGDSLVIADATAGAIVYTLLKAAIEVGDRITIQKIDASAHTVTLKAATGDNIDQLTQIVLTDQLQVVEVLSQG